MSCRTHTIRSRLTLPLLALTTMAATLATVPASAQHAAASPHDGIGLALRGGATLAPLKILDLSSNRRDISQVVGDRAGGERLRESNTSVTYELQAEVLFAKDCARLSVTARSRVAAIARVIAQQSPRMVRVCGYTDDLGSAAHGVTLSRQRAAAVKSVLAGQLEGSAITFGAFGLGEGQPIASNATEAGRRQNRRVEIAYSSTIT
ncbi:OmpA family protein [Streptomyces sp. NPDC048419]|uniref:OmpA family protein n=1 Tax=Streptomyces sp. NPDC048419 TaxID=3365547 RepID=UPI0037136CDF